MDNNFKYHTVSIGESLSSIASTYGLSLNELMIFNNLISPIIKEGQTLYLEDTTSSVFESQMHLHTDWGTDTFVYDTPHPTETETTSETETETTSETETETTAETETETTAETETETTAETETETTAETETETEDVEETPTETDDDPPNTETPTDEPEETNTETPTEEPETPAETATETVAASTDTETTAETPTETAGTDTETTAETPTETAGTDTETAETPTETSGTDTETAETPTETETASETPTETETFVGDTAIETAGTDTETAETPTSTDCPEGYQLTFVPDSFGGSNFHSGSLFHSSSSHGQYLCIPSTATETETLETPTTTQTASATQTATETQTTYKCKTVANCSGNRHNNYAQAGGQLVSTAAGSSGSVGQNLPNDGDYDDFNDSIALGTYADENGNCIVVSAGPTSALPDGSHPCPNSINIGSGSLIAAPLPGEPDNCDSDKCKPPTPTPKCYEGKNADTRQKCWDTYTSEPCSGRCINQLPSPPNYPCPPYVNCGMDNQNPAYGSIDWNIANGQFNGRTVFFKTKTALTGTTVVCASYGGEPGRVLIPDNNPECFYECDEEQMEEYENSFKNAPGRADTAYADGFAEVSECLDCMNCQQKKQKKTRTKGGPGMIITGFFGGPGPGPGGPNAGPGPNQVPGAPAGPAGPAGPGPAGPAGPAGPGPGPGPGPSLPPSGSTTYSITSGPASVSTTTGSSTSNVAVSGPGGPSGPGLTGIVGPATTSTSATTSGTTYNSTSGPGGPGSTTGQTPGGPTVGNTSGPSGPGPSGNPCPQGYDCAGVCGGGAIVDCAGVCNPVEAAREDCFGNCFSYPDFLTSPNFKTYDCAGVCGGRHVLDACGVCGGFAQTINDCHPATIPPVTAHPATIIPASGTFTETLIQTFPTPTAIVTFPTPTVIVTFPTPTAIKTFPTPSTCHTDYDCEGTCGGGVYPDCSGECGGSSKEDCSGECGGYGIIDCNGNCGTGLTFDCLGVCGGSAKHDCEGVCDGKARIDCDGKCIKECDLPLGNFSCVDSDCKDDVDCAGVCGGNNVIDCSGKCIHVGEALYRDSDGICGGSKTLTNCVHRVDCAGVCGGKTLIDCDGVCGGTNFSCDCEQQRDCFGICGGTARLDCLGICGGSATYDCAGVCNGNSKIDQKGDCGGQFFESGCTEGYDCEGVCGGSAKYDKYNICKGNHNPFLQSSNISVECSTIKSKRMLQFNSSIDPLCPQGRDVCGVCGGLENDFYSCPETPTDINWNLDYNILVNSNSSTICGYTTGGKPVFLDACGQCFGTEFDSSNCNSTPTFTPFIVPTTTLTLTPCSSSSCGYDLYGTCYELDVCGECGGTETNPANCSSITPTSTEPLRPVDDCKYYYVTWRSTLSNAVGEREYSAWVRDPNQNNFLYETGNSVHCYNPISIVGPMCPPDNFLFYGGGYSPCGSQSDYFKPAGIIYNGQLPNPFECDIPLTSGFTNTYNEVCGKNPWGGCKFVDACGNCGGGINDYTDCYNYTPTPETETETSGLGCHLVKGLWLDYVSGDTYTAWFDLNGDPNLNADFNFTDSNGSHCYTFLSYFDTSNNPSSCEPPYGDLAPIYHKAFDPCPTATPETITPPTFDPLSGSNPFDSICINHLSTVYAENGIYNFNSLGSYNENIKYGLGIGTYALDVPSSHPIFLEGNIADEIHIYGSHTVSGQYGVGYHGRVIIEVKADFNTISYKCSYHGYMGGKNNLVFDPNCSQECALFPLESCNKNMLISSYSESTPTPATLTSFDYVACIDPYACNYDPYSISGSYFSCEYASCSKCRDQNACNFVPCEDYLCYHNQYICDYSCHDEYGCKDPSATNYNKRSINHKQSLCQYNYCIAQSYLLNDASYGATKIQLPMEDYKLFSVDDIITIGNDPQELTITGIDCCLYLASPLNNDHKSGELVKVIKRTIPKFGFDSTPTETAPTQTTTQSDTETQTSTDTETQTDPFSYHPTIPPTYTPQTQTCTEIYGGNKYLKMMSVYGNTIDRDSLYTFNPTLAGQEFTLERDAVSDPHISSIEWASCWKIVGKGTIGYDSSGNKNAGCFTPGAYMNKQCETKEFTFTNNASSNWVVSGTDDVTTHTNANNPTITISEGDVLVMQNNANSTHPLKIYNSLDIDITTLSGGGFTYLANPGAYGGVKVYFSPQSSGTFYYKCGNHSSAMNGQITVTGSNPEYPITPT